jgi:hypothetical protein
MNLHNGLLLDDKNRKISEDVKYIDDKLELRSFLINIDRNDLETSKAVKKDTKVFICAKEIGSGEYTYHYIMLATMRSQNIIIIKYDDVNDTYILEYTKLSTLKNDDAKDYKYRKQYRINFKWDFDNSNFINISFRTKIELNNELFIHADSFTSERIKAIDFDNSLVINKRLKFINENLLDVVVCSALNRCFEFLNVWKQNNYSFLDCKLPNFYYFDVETIFVYARVLNMSNKKYCSKTLNVKIVK